MNRTARLWRRATVSLRARRLAHLKGTAMSRPLAVLLALAMLIAPSSLVAWAEGITPPVPVTPTTTVVEIAAGEGSQSDPHISGTLVSYTDNSISSIRYYNFATGITGTIPRSDGLYDLLSDVNGSKITFRRESAAGSVGIYVFDVNNPDAGVQEVYLQSGSFPRRSAIGNGTIVWEDRAYDASSQPEIKIYDPVVSQVITLTNDTTADQMPAVSEDGTAVAWVKCPGATTCDVYSATRSGGWAPLQITGAEGSESLPDTNGAIVVYGSTAGGDDNIHWRPVGGGTDNWLAMTGVQRNPNISGNLIAFESNAAVGTQFDIYVYDLSQGSLYQLTNTSVSETLSDISVGADGKARVVWAQPKQVYPYDMDVYGLTFDPPQASLTLTVQPLFDQTHARRVGSVVPIRLQLLDAQTNNVSSASLVLTVTGLVQKDGSAVTAVVDDAGNANPDYAFRYDETLRGYTYNLSTKGMSTGTWELKFTASGDPNIHSILFDLK